MIKKDTYKEQIKNLQDEIKSLKVKLEGKEQTISILYNLLKDIIFWRKDAH